MAKQIQIKRKDLQKMKKLVKPINYSYEYEQLENGDYVVKSLVTDDVFKLSQESMHKLFRKQYDERG